LEKLKYSRLLLAGGLGRSHAHNDRDWPTHKPLTNASGVDDTRKARTNEVGSFVVKTSEDVQILIHK
jgi:hypothetical protein